MWPTCARHSAVSVHDLDGGYGVPKDLKVLFIFSARRELCPVLHSDVLVKLRTMAFAMISATAAFLTSSPSTFSTAASLIARSEEVHRP